MMKMEDGRLARYSEISEITIRGGVSSNGSVQCQDLLPRRTKNSRFSIRGLFWLLRISPSPTSTPASRIDAERLYFVAYWRGLGHVNIGNEVWGLIELYWLIHEELYSCSSLIYSGKLRVHTSYVPNLSGINRIIWQGKLFYWDTRKEWNLI